MATDLEKQFFFIFGIEPKQHIHHCQQGCCKPDKECGYCEHHTISEYPQISDCILLELFDILRKYYNLDFWTIDDSFVMDVRDKQASYTNIIYRTGGDLKHSILSSLQLIVNRKLNYNENIKHQVRTLFEEG